MTEHSLPNKIAKLCIQHFQGLPKTGKPGNKEWTVLSCIVKQDIVTDSFEVVSLGTGSKCIGKQKMSANGDILNDSHAEVVCRRAFVKYIYGQMESNSTDIFTFDFDTLKFHLRDSIRFHFFTTHVPCGDAAIFPKQDSKEFGDALNLTSNNSILKRCADSDINLKNKMLKPNLQLNEDCYVDINRTGAKCLPEEKRQDLCLSGLEFHTVGAIRTKPGRGDPTLSVSCSDKISKWCHLGIQGALLSILIRDPIYLSSFTVCYGTYYNKEALIRAFYGRFRTVRMQPPFQLKEMLIEQSSLISFENQKVESKHPCPSSIAWCKTTPFLLEVAVEGKRQGATKKKQITKTGRLKISKIELFRSFLTVVDKIKLNLFEDIPRKDLEYRIAKAKANEYQEMWNYLKTNVFKIWAVKDDALLQFVID